MSTQRKNRFRISDEQSMEVFKERSSFEAGERALAKIGGRECATFAAPAVHTGKGKAEAAANATLPRDSWIDRDQRLMSILKTSARVTDSLVDPCTRSVNLGKKKYEYIASSKMGQVSRSLTFADMKTKSDRPDVRELDAPIVVFQSPYEIPFEDMLLDSAEFMGQIALEASEQAMDEMWRDIEDIVVNGGTVDGQAIEGLRSTGTHRKRSQTQGSLRTPTGSDTLGGVWEKNVQTIANLLAEQGHEVSSDGAFNLYVNDQDWLSAGYGEFYKSGYPMKVAQVVRQLPGVRAVIPSRTVPQNEMIAVIPDVKWLTLATGLPPRHRGILRTDPMAPFQFEVTAKMAPVVKRDYGDATGIAHLYA